MSDKLRDRQLYEQMKSKHVGVGNADTTREEFISNMKRDTYATLISHSSLLDHLSVSLNKPKRLLHSEMIDKMAKPLANVHKANDGK
ncbi:unnamed protein product [Ambrosiozyma monospora]|uniref:Unnamed protein product n=1 Tax=Ambrosiozyma monospora TaxID=43982 RepID=A0A9W6YUD7_AMBMO|nr:unnamed protein product [Ambrosiozyma monospora]